MDFNTAMSLGWAGTVPASRPAGRPWDQQVIGRTNVERHRQP